MPIQLCSVHVCVVHSGAPRLKKLIIRSNTRDTCADVHLNLIRENSMAGRRPSIVGAIIGVFNSFGPIDETEKEEEDRRGALNC